jgi:hypothetical protein
MAGGRGRLASDDEWPFLVAPEFGPRHMFGCGRQSFGPSSEPLPQMNSLQHTCHARRVQNAGLAFIIGIFAIPMLAKDPQLPSLEKALAGLTASGFREEVNQIPATVIDTGILKYVPYLSYRAGDDRELNVYGDPSAPACVEIGLYRKLLNSDGEKRQCINYLRAIFPDGDFFGMSLTGGKVLRGGIVIEVTPPDAPDAYGGWWVSVYSLPLIRAATGTSTSLSAVTVSRAEIVAAPIVNSAPAQSAAPVEPARSTEWTARDLSRARPSSSGSNGQVYVRSYVRKDGTYVRSHSRSR